MRSIKHKSEYISTEEVADFLGMAPRTVTAWANVWVESGGTEGLPAVKIGRRKWGFDPESVEHWLDDQQRAKPKLLLRKA